MFKRVSSTPSEFKALVTLASEDGLCLITITGETAEKQAAHIMNISGLVSALRTLEDAVSEVLERKHSDLHQMDRDMLHNAVAMAQGAMRDSQKGNPKPQNQASATEEQEIAAFALVRQIAEMERTGESPSRILADLVQSAKNIMKGN
jgi:crotonobetainyl-CoA:carnitine CoA-transferase CaiB-like acyl-CoA transferase